MENLEIVEWDLEDLEEGCHSIIENLNLKEFDPENTVIYGIARGGVVPASIISNELKIDYFPVYRIKDILIRRPYTNKKYRNIIIIDDRAQTGSSLCKSRREFLRVYSGFVLNPVVKTGLLNSLDICNYTFDYVYKVTNKLKKIKFPWDNRTCVTDKTKSSIVKAFREFDEVDKIINEEIKKNPNVYFNMFSDYEIEILKKYHEKIIKSPSDEFLIKGELIDVSSVNDVLNKFRLLKENGLICAWDFDVYVEDSNRVCEIFIEEDMCKDTIVELTIRESPEGTIDFTTSSISNGFGRCEPTRYEPHYFCNRNCKFKPENKRNVKTFNCFGVINSLIFLQKIKNVIGSAKIMDIDKIYLP